jgi:AraC-like DNA-binding protein
MRFRAAMSARTPSWTGCLTCRSGSVAGKVGYGSAYALSAAFKRVRGIRPGYYRHAEQLRAQAT